MLEVRREKTFIPLRTFAALCDLCECFILIEFQDCLLQGD